MHAARAPLLVAPLLLALAAPFARAQDTGLVRPETQPSTPTTTSSPHSQLRRWTLSIVTGRPSLAPLTEFEQAMRDASFDWSGNSCVFDLCFGESTYPYSAHTRIYRDTWAASAHRLLGRRVGVGVTTGASFIGSTVGRHRSSFTWLEVETAVAHLAPLATFTPWAGVRVGAGPGLFTTTFREKSVGTLVETTTVRRPGLLAETSLTFPRRTRVFVDLTGQMRWLTAPSFGPVSRYDAATGVTAIFPRTAVDMTHWMVGLGAGLRF